MRQKNKNATQNDYWERAVNFVDRLFLTKDRDLTKLIISINKIKFSHIDIEDLKQECYIIAYSIKQRCSCKKSKENCEYSCNKGFKKEFIANIKDVINSQRNFKEVSFECIDGYEKTFQSYIEDNFVSPSQNIDYEEKEALIKQIISIMPTKKQRRLWEVYLKNQDITQTQLSNILGISRQGVSAMINKSLKYLQEYQFKKVDNNDIYINTIQEEYNV